MPKPSELSRRSQKESAASPLAAAYFAERRAAVDPFVRRHFSLAGSLRLHRASIGWDLLRAPVNVALSPAYVASRLFAWMLRRIGLATAGQWLNSRQVLLRTNVARRVDELILRELLLMPVAHTSAQADRPKSERAQPRLRQLGDYSSVRSAVNEVSVALTVLVAGALFFGVVSPGFLSLTPSAAQALATRAAVESFPLGSTIGSIWYGVFPPDATIWLNVVVGFGLAAITSILATFAGVIADPIQLHLGVHRRRLIRLIASLEAEYAKTGRREFVAREQYFARLADISDVGVSLIRFLRS